MRSLPEILTLIQEAGPGENVPLTKEEGELLRSFTRGGLLRIDSDSADSAENGNPEIMKLQKSQDYGIPRFQCTEHTYLMRMQSMIDDAHMKLADVRRDICKPETMKKLVLDVHELNVQVAKLTGKVSILECPERIIKAGKLSPARSPEDEDRYALIEVLDDIMRQRRIIPIPTALADKYDAHRRTLSEGGA